MNRTSRVLILAATAISVIIVSAVCWHSVEEIHYLKSFYPQQFSVEEAFYASGVELFKVLIICVPFFFAVLVGIFLLQYWKIKSWSVGLDHHTQPHPPPRGRCWYFEQECK